MKYVYLGLFIIGCVGLTYMIYSLELNRKLNIKKRQIAIRPKKNRYIIMAFINLSFIFVFGGLSIYKFTERKDVPVAPIQENKENDINKKVDTDVKYLSLKNTDIGYYDEQNVLTDKDATFFVENKKLNRVDLKTNEIKNIDAINCDGLLLTKKHIVIYYNSVIENKNMFTLEIYDKDELLLIKKVDGDGKILFTSVNKGLFSGNEFDIVLETFDVSDKETIGYVVTNYSYEEVELENENEEEIVKDIVCKEEIEEKVILENINYSKNYDYDRFLIHLQCNLASFNISEVAFALTDYFIVYSEDFYYIYCNCFKDENYENKSYVLKYNHNDMEIVDYHLFENVIYSSPIIYKYDLLSTYMTFITYNINYSNYQKVTIDTLLNIIDIKDIYVDNELNNKKHTCIFDNKVSNFENILYFDNNRLINYEVDEDQILIKEYILREKIINSYRLSIDDSAYLINDLKINDLARIDKVYFVTYTIGDKNGYIYFDRLEDNSKKIKVEEDPSLPNEEEEEEKDSDNQEDWPKVIIEEKKEVIKQEEDVVLKIFDSNRYYISIDFLVVVNEENEVDILEIKDILKGEIEPEEKTDETGDE